MKEVQRQSKYLGSPDGSSDEDNEQRIGAVTRDLGLLALKEV